MTVVSSIGVSVDTTDKLQAAVRRLLRQEVLVGVPDTAAERQPEPGENRQASNAMIGYVQEFGDDEKNIPPRPFLLPGVQDVRDKIVDRLKRAGEAALTGTLSSVDNEFQAVGLIAQNAVRARITEGPFTPLSERTLQARKAKGRTGDKPLIDTGQLRQSVTYVVKDKGST